MSISQRIDQDDTASARFLQRLYLTHCSSSAPVVFSPMGYELANGLTRAEATTAFAF